MQIDWVTVAAQIVNFLVLVWLLKRFLYGPIVRAMQRREQHIADRLGEADEKLQAAEEKAKAYEAKERELEGKREDLLRQARQEAEDYRKELRAEVEKEVEQERRQRREQLERERRDLVRELRRQVAEQFEALARRALQDLADRDLEAQIAEVFARQVADLDAEVRGDIAEAAGADDGRLAIYTAFDLPEPARERVREALQSAFGTHLEVEFSTDESLACGIELRAAGHSVLWSLDSYLEIFERRFAENLDEMAAQGQAKAA